MGFRSSYVRRPPSCVYLILKIEADWIIDREGKTCGPYQTQQEAEAAAFKLIELFGEPGRRLEVWSPDKDGKARLIWKGELPE